MMKMLYYVHTSGYDMVVSVDSDNFVRALICNDSFPILSLDDLSDCERLSFDFLNSIDSDDTWECFGVVDDLDDWMGIRPYGFETSVIFSSVFKEVY